VLLFYLLFCVARVCTAQTGKITQCRMQSHMCVAAVADLYWSWAFGKTLTINTDQPQPPRTCMTALIHTLCFISNFVTTTTWIIPGVPNTGALDMRGSLCTCSYARTSQADRNMECMIQFYMCMAAAADLYCSQHARTRMTSHSHQAHARLHQHKPCTKPSRAPPVPLPLRGVISAASSVCVRLNRSTGQGDRLWDAV
jgi:hypothetical protein